LIDITLNELTCIIVVRTVKTLVID